MIRNCRKISCQKTQAQEAKAHRAMLYGGFWVYCDIGNAIFRKRERARAHEAEIIDCR